MNELYQQQDFLYTTFWKMLAWGIFLTCLCFTWRPWSPMAIMVPYRISGDQSANVNWSKTITAIGDVNIKEMASGCILQISRSQNLHTKRYSLPAAISGAEQLHIRHLFNIYYCLRNSVAVLVALIIALARVSISWREPNPIEAYILQY